jgi:hypothetical protein
MIKVSLMKVRYPILTARQGSVNQYNGIVVAIGC